MVAYIRRVTVLVILLYFIDYKPICGKTYTPNDIARLRERVLKMFHHAYDGYIKYAYPYDELRPLTCDGLDTWGSYSLTLIDALDTLAIMGNYTEFQRVASLVIDRMNFDIDINASVFETNIRILGGLLSAHLLSHRAGVTVEQGWPCSGPMLRMAEDVARRLLPAFDTPTGMPYGTVNLRHGVPKGETTVTCTAGIGTFMVEFGTLSRLTGDPVFEKVAIRAMRSLWKTRSEIGLVGNHIDVGTGKWTAVDAGIGGGIDSYFEYLVKAGIMFEIPELLQMFHEYSKAVKTYLKRDDWYMWANMKKGGITLPMFTSLDAYWPGIQSMLGNIDEAMKTMHNFHQIWKQYGFLPEYYNIPKSEVHGGREGYPLRPEFVESAMYLYRATKDPFLLEVGEDMLESIEHSTKTECGYATVKNVATHQLENRMESFFLAETTKYLYLLFDPDNFIHNNGSTGTVIQTPNGECVIDAGGYFFNTEAHPVDVASVYCCSAQKKEDDKVLQKMHDNLDLLALLDIVEPVDTVRGTKWKTLKQELEKEKKEAEERKEKQKMKMQSMDDNKIVKTENKNKDAIPQKTDTSHMYPDKKSHESTSASDSKGGSVQANNEFSKEENNYGQQKKGDPSENNAEHTDKIDKFRNVTHNVNNDVKTTQERIDKPSESKMNIIELDSKSEKVDSNLKSVKSEPDSTIQNVNTDSKSEKVDSNSKSVKSEPDSTSQNVDTDSKSEKVDSTNIYIKSTSAEVKNKNSKNPVNSANTNLEKFFIFLLNKIGNLDAKDKSPDVFNLYRLMQYYSLSYHAKPELMSCPAQPFHMRVSVNGEMFEDDYK